MTPDEQLAALTAKVMELEVRCNTALEQLNKKSNFDTQADVLQSALDRLDLSLDAVGGALKA